MSDGLRNICKECAKLAAKAWQAVNPERHMANMRAYCSANKDRLREHGRRWTKLNAARRLASNANRRSARRRATPAWYGELDAFVLEEAYTLRDMRRRMFGFDWHVDHVVPLCGDTVCGLHWHKNWAVIPAAVNLSKSNRF